MRQLKISKQNTDRDGVLSLYFKDVAKIQLLTIEEEVDLITKAQAGDKKALDAVVLANTRFVISVAKQYPCKKLEIGDLISAGNEGLIKAALRFDHTRGFKFISFAVWWIRQAIQQTLSEDDRLVRLPLNKIGIQSKIAKIATIFEQEEQRQPTTTEVIDIYAASEGRMTDINDEFVTDYLATMGNREFSIDASVSSSSESSTEYSNFMEGVNNVEDIFDKHDSKKALRMMVSTLHPREQYILTKHYGLDGETALSLEQLGMKLELTRERVRQLRENGIRKLKKHTNKKILMDLLGQS